MWFRRLLSAVKSERAAALLLLAFLILERALDPVPLQVLRLKTFDFYQTLKPRVVQELPVAIVDIDERSLEAYGQWPWSRILIADLATRIAEMGAVSIGVDILFPEPDRLSPKHLVDEIKGIPEQAKELLLGLPDNDKVFAEVIRRFQIVLSQSGLGKVGRDENRKYKQTPIVIVGEDPAPYLMLLPNRLGNIEVLDEAAGGQGLVTIIPEIDGIVRRVPALMVLKDAIVPTMAIELLRVGLGEKSIAVRTTRDGITRIGLGKNTVSTDGNGLIWLNASKHDPRRYISAVDILSGQTSPDAIAGKIVLIGTSATGLFDQKSTAVEAVIPGVEIHAQLLENIIAGAALGRPAFALGLEIVLTALACIAMIIAVPILGARIVLAVGFFVSAAVVAISWYFYLTQRVLIDISFPLLCSIAVYWLLVLVNYLREERRRISIRSAFSRYVSRELVEKLANKPDELVLGGETREITILFTDIRQFTKIAEAYKNDPQGLTLLINRFLTPLSAAILARRGTIDKYMGDAIMAFWNAPADVAQHRSLACEAALDMIARLSALNDELRNEAGFEAGRYHPLKAGIGINTGVCVVGNLGSDLRFDYSALGDAVNLASRIEGLTKQYGVSILIGEQTAAAAMQFALLEVDLIRVVGKDLPERIYAVLGDKALASTDGFMALATRHRAMLDAYRSQRWAAARDALESERLIVPEGIALDGLLDTYAGRIAGYSSDPPGADWDGIANAREK